MLQKIFIKEHEDLILANGYSLEEFEDLPGNNQADYIEYWKDQDKKKRRSEIYHNYEEASLKMLGNYLQDTERQKALKDFKSQMAKEVEDKKQGKLGEGKELIQRTRLEWNREKIMYFFRDEQPNKDQTSSEPQQRSIFDLRNVKKRINKKEMLKALEEKQRMYSERFNKRSVFEYTDERRESPENLNGKAVSIVGDLKQQHQPRLDEELLYGQFSDSDHGSYQYQSNSSSKASDKEVDDKETNVLLNKPAELDEFEKMLAQGLSAISKQPVVAVAAIKRTQTVAQEPKPLRPSKPSLAPGVSKNIPRQGTQKPRKPKNSKPTFKELQDDDVSDEQAVGTLEDQSQTSSKHPQSPFKRTKDDIQAQMHKLKTLFDDEDDEDQLFSSSQNQASSPTQNAAYTVSQRVSTHHPTTSQREIPLHSTNENNMQPDSSEVLCWLDEEEGYLSDVRQHRTLEMRELGDGMDPLDGPGSPATSQSGEGVLRGFSDGGLPHPEQSPLLFRPEYELKAGIGKKMQMLQAEFMDKKVPSVSDLISDPLDSLKQLLDLFGIPYVESPGEAEAQCARLEIEGKVDGVITEDSDAFLFGSKRVIRGLFGSGGNPEEFTLNQIELELGFSREQLIMLALFLGCDYAIGIHGVGIVNAVEIVDAYGTLDALSRFKKWAEKPDYWMDKSVYEESRRAHPTEYQYMLKHRNYKKEWTLPDEFPSSKVVDAFMNPDVTISHPIEYKLFDVNKVIEFATKAFQFSGEGFTMWKEALRQEYERRTKPQQSIEDFYKPVHYKFKIKSTRLQTSLLNLKTNKINEGLADIEQSLLSNMSIQQDSNPKKQVNSRASTKLRREEFDTGSERSSDSQDYKPVKKPKLK
jgi:5'-3' exonuclease